MTITQTHMVGTDARGIAAESAPAASAQWMPSLRYPDPAISILHPSFEKYRLRNASVERLATGMRWCEGPVWFGDGRFLLGSDIANDSIYGLAAGVWTRDLDTALRMIKEIEAGMIWVNCFDEGDMTQPFGGYKQSGNARDKCLESFLSYTQTKSAWIRLSGGK